MVLEQSSNESNVFVASAPKTSHRSYLPNEPMAAPHTGTEGDSPDEDFICHECRQVDWDSLPQLARSMRMARRSGTTLTMETDHDHLVTSSCKVCQVLSAVMPPSLSKTEFVVEARSLLDFAAYAVPRFPGTSFPGKGITALQVCPRGEKPSGGINDSRCLVAIRRDVENFSTGTITPRLIDYDWLKGLARLCEVEHWGDCTHMPSDPASISGLMVIEVSSRTVIEAPAGCKYVALSYTWGKQPRGGLESHLQHPPPLIEDAISVTIAMGYEYLWIDIYCIPQVKNSEKHRLIKQMDEVYSNASLTIIDASGQDAQRGLPGVSSFSRQLQKRVTIRNTTILEMPCGFLELNSSKWITRGWTYQEGYFSTRRLIFTASQVLFLCNASYAEESVYRLLRRVSLRHATDITTNVTTDTRRFRHIAPDSERIEAMPSKSALLLQLEEYSRRELTYHSDSLNAFLGVLNSYSRKTYTPVSKFLHIAWGLFVRKQSDKDGFHIYLHWHHEAPAIRRPEFPSWTWAGWGGPLIMDGAGIRVAMLRHDHWPLSHLDWEISWWLEGYRAVNIVDSARYLLNAMYTNELQRHQQPNYPKQLQITCLVVPMRFRTPPPEAAQWNQGTEVSFENVFPGVWVGQMDRPKDIIAILQLCKGVYIAAVPFLDQGLGKREGVVGLLFAREEETGLMTLGCLLARQLENGLYERIGAIPHLMVYPRDDSGHVYKSLARLNFLDEAGGVLDKVRVPARQRELPFDDVGERRTIFLV